LELEYLGHFRCDSPLDADAHFGDQVRGLDEMVDWSYRGIGAAPAGTGVERFLKALAKTWFEGAR